MAKVTRWFACMLLATAIVHAKPLDSPIDQSINEVNHDNASPQEDLFVSQKQARNSALPTNEEPVTAAVQFDATDSAAGTVIDTTVRPLEETPTTRPGPFSWFLTPLTQKIQFSPQSFLQDRLILLKEALNQLGISSASNNATTRQLSGPGGLLHLASLNDPDFYTNRLEPVGFLGGNGWFANKGGILGGPGAILSTGSLLTDYPTAYRRK